MGWLTGDTGGSKRQTQSWWNKNSREATMDPGKIRVRGGTINRRDVERYKRNPNARATGGDEVYVVKLRGGGYFAREGAHRITAAREAGRKVRVRVVDERDEQR